MTAAADLRRLYEARLYSPEVPSTAIHGVHLDCQRDAPFYVSRCGLVMEDSGHQTTVNSDVMRPCQACNRVTKCPLCGTPLPQTVTTLISWRDWE